MTASDSTGPASAAPDNPVLPDNTVRLDDADALIWAVERDPTLASTVSSLSLFDSPVDPEAFRIRLERATRLVVRMRQRVVGNPLSLSPPRWEVDPEFNLDNHLRVVECPGDGTLRDALDLAAPFNAAPFDKERPLFDMLLIQGIDGDKTGLVMKAHHAIADGMGMLQIQLELFDFEPDTENPELPPEPQADPLSPGERLGNALEFERGRARTSLRDLGTAVVKNLTSGDGDAMDQALDTVAAGIRSIVPAPPMSPVLVERSADTWHDTMSVPVADLKAAGKRAGTRMNAAFVAAVARGLGLFHEQSGERCPLLRMGMPVNVRVEGAEATGNHLQAIRVELPLIADEPDHLIEICQALIDSHRADPAQSIIGPAQQLLARLPAQLSGFAFAQVLRGSDFLTSNLPGSPVPMYIGSAEMMAQYPFGPTSAAAVNVTLLSYQEAANIGISVDPAATSNPHLVADCIRQGFDWVLEG